ncbi:Transcriptional regulator, TetR family [Methanosarcina horonobensis HB-1 = JCM 15518]|uniref:Transcriptional regulator, TetR family n=2 Tax=Methanosarcina horonobensis TaxID=418008 RepID=A0A0E3WTQ3_9EURY|nr:TetR/AcrR family transcriptional regulator [Methanosarcina horonobensis]AKB76830.1 Transcriptional regulator, TetR family [Methanosarcina horonobensis HB-1 = JCM 15518]
MFTKLLHLEPKRRDAIINAALKEFASKGYDDASTNVIAKESGISKGLLFHYINTKKDLFLFLFDYCNQVLKEEYFDLINFNERDILERFRQTYLLKVDVIHKYPRIFEFIKVALLTETNEVKKELEERKKTGQSSGYEIMFENIDDSKFREGLDVEKCKKLIFWAIMGYSTYRLEEIRNLEINDLDFEEIQIEFDSYLDELRKSFYK